LLLLAAVGDNPAMIDPLRKGDAVRINDGTFKGYVGVVDKVNEPDGKAIVFIQIPGVRDPTPVQLEQRQLDRV
jgi:transcription antitermination factor NusG